MVEDVKLKQLGIEPAISSRGARKSKYSLMAREVPAFCGLVRHQAPKRALEIGDRDVPRVVYAGIRWPQLRVARPLTTSVSVSATSFR